MRAQSTMTVALSLLVCVLLASCISTDGRTYPNATDLARAQAAWSDPWLAGEVATATEPQGPLPQVRRDVAGRNYATTSLTRAAVTTEVRAALASGWRLIGAFCAPDEEGSLGSAKALLAQGRSADDLRVARVSASEEGYGAQAMTQVGVGAWVPHHRDPEWVLPTPIALEASCLVKKSIPPPAVGAPVTSPSPSTVPEPTPDDLSGDRVGTPEWGNDPVPDDLRSALEELRADPGIRSLGLKITEPGDTGDSRPRRAAQSETVPVDRGALAETVTSLTSQGWALTYAACIGPGAPHVAELSRTVGPRHAVLRLSQVPPTTSTKSAAAAALTEANVVISTPGYSLKPGAPISNPCFAKTQVPQAFEHRGTPALGPTRMLPLLK